MNHLFKCRIQPDETAALIKKRVGHIQFPYQDILQTAEFLCKSRHLFHVDCPAVDKGCCHDTCIDQAGGRNSQKRSPVKEEDQKIRHPENDPQDDRDPEITGNTSSSSLACRFPFGFRIGRERIHRLCFVYFLHE